MASFKTLPKEKFAELFDEVHKAVADPAQADKSLADILRGYDFELELPPMASQNLSKVVNTPISAMAATDNSACNGCSGCALCILCEEVNAGAGLAAAVGLVGIT